MTEVAEKIHADIDALKELRDALTRFRHAQREVVERGDQEIEATRASLEAKAGLWGSLLARRQDDFAACQAMGREAEAGRPADCSAEASAVREAQERLDQIRRWQQRVDEEASTFRGTSGRFRDLLDRDLPRTESHLLAIITGLEAARGLQVAGS
jgi:hypothetical protein